MEDQATQLRERSLAVVRTIAELRRALAAFRSAGRTIGLIPTMGALHDGHLSLVRSCARARRHASDVDLRESHPVRSQRGFRRLSARRGRRFRQARCAPVAGWSSRRTGTKCIPARMLTTVTVSGLTDGLCGPLRPGHFQGVATVVSKLLMMAMPDRAYFGEKDYQQLQVIKCMVRDLAMPIEIVGVPTVREPDGLAMSSRNLYLSTTERAIARLLYRELTSVADAVRDGRTSCSAAVSDAAQGVARCGIRQGRVPDRGRCRKPSSGRPRHRSGASRGRRTAWSHALDRQYRRRLTPWTQKSRPIGAALLEWLQGAQPA